MTHYTVHTANELRMPCLPADARGQGVQALAKDFVASSTPHGHGLLRSAHEHAIYLDSIWVGMRGYTDVFSAMLVLGAALMASNLLRFELTALVELPGKGESPILWLGFLLLELFTLLVVLFSLLFALRGFRIGLFSPKDLPLVFNRKTRKVYTLSLIHI